MHPVQPLFLRRIKTRGFVTSVDRMGDYVELHAGKLPASEPVYIARVDGDSDHDVERTAQELAAMWWVAPDWSRNES